MIVSIYEHSSFIIHRGIDNHATQVLTARRVDNLILMHIHSTFFIPHAFLSCMARKTYNRRNHTMHTFA
jgi:hypothetical protein